MHCSRTPAPPLQREACGPREVPGLPASGRGSWRHELQLSCSLEGACRARACSWQQAAMSGAQPGAQQQRLARGVLTASRPAPLLCLPAVTAVAKPCTPGEKGCEECNEQGTKCLTCQTASGWFKQGNGCRKVGRARRRRSRPARRSRMRIAAACCWRATAHLPRRPEPPRLTSPPAPFRVQCGEPHSGLYCIQCSGKNPTKCTACRDPEGLRGM